MAHKSHFDLELFFQSLGDKTRLRILNLIGDQEICVCYFVEVLNCPQPKVSRHLAYLRRAGIVTVRRDGKWMHYRICMPPHAGATHILRQTLAALKDEKSFQTDTMRLAKACCSPKVIPALDGAPLPTLVQIAPSADCC